MLTISKPLSSAQVRTYHAEEFSNAGQNYYTTGDQIRGHDADVLIMPRRMSLQSKRRTIRRG